VRGYAALRRQTEKIVILVEMLRIGASMPCFIGSEQAVTEIRQRLTPHSGMTDIDYRDYIN
jgi:hypothetical protein